MSITKAREVIPFKILPPKPAGHCALWELPVGTFFKLKGGHTPAIVLHKRDEEGGSRQNGCKAIWWKYIHRPAYGEEQHYQQYHRNDGGIFNGSYMTQREAKIKNVIALDLEDMTFRERRDSKDNKPHDTF